MNSLYDLDLPGLNDQIRAWGESPYRAQQIWEGLYRQLWVSPAEFTNLSKPLRERLTEEFCQPDSQPGTHSSAAPEQRSIIPIQPLRDYRSSDGQTIKTLFKLNDGQLIEAVLMRYSRRRTLCISTQVGCAMGCVFCATGQMGFHRHLSSGEIVAQVIYYAHQLASLGEQVTNVVVMGMGEPFHNYAATMEAIDRLNHPQGFNFSARRFTISTVGLVPVIQRFTQEHRQVNLAVSLHAADDELRTSLLPVNRKYPLSELFAACQEYVRLTHRRLTFEWALIQDVNDTPEQANKLAVWLKTLRQGGTILAHVNVIPLNPTRRFPGQATTRQRAEAFQAELAKYEIPCTIRLRRGIDIQAGCGQLAVENH